MFLQGSIGAPTQVPFASLPGGCWPVISEMTMASILIIDDQPCVRQIISEELILEGHRVRSLGDVELVGAHLQRFQTDIVLLDLFLDEFEGFGVCRDIKCRHPELPVVILTAYDSFEDDPRLCMADGYVVKSCDFTELKTKVFDILAQQPVPQKEILMQACLFDLPGSATP
jgi:two-component system response regulator (stage 0 sporulation protein F)